MQFTVKQNRMTLGEWLQANSMSNLEFAKLIGCAEQSVQHWREKIYKPHRLNRREILRVTNYEVEI